MAEVYQRLALISSILVGSVPHSFHWCGIGFHQRGYLRKPWLILEVQTVTYPVLLFTDDVENRKDL